MTHTPSEQQAVEQSDAERYGPSFDRALMDTPQAADAELARLSAEYRDLRKPFMGSAKAIKQRQLREREVLFNLGHAALHWLWHREDAAPTAPSTAAGERTFRHRKRGTSYAVQGYASLQAETPCEEGAVLVVYKGEDGKLWARPHDEFHDGRFEEIAALATPPAQKFIPADIEQWRALARKVGDFLHRKGEEFRRGDGAELLDAYEAVLARPEMRDTPPAAPAAEPPKTSWPEQAAQQCEAWAKAHRSTDMELFCRIFADDFRALARSEKGEGK